MRRIAYLCLLILVLLVGCGTPASFNYPIVTPNFDLEARARELIENPLPVLEPMLDIRMRENVVQYQGFKANAVDVYDRVEVDIDLQQLCLTDGTIGEAQDYVMAHIEFRLCGQVIDSLGSNLTIESVSGTDYREERCDSQERLIMTVSACVKFGAAAHFGEIDLTLRDGSVLHYEYGLEVSSGVSFK